MQILKIHTLSFCLIFLASLDSQAQKPSETTKEIVLLENENH